MELIIYLVSAVSVFFGVIAFVVGLVSAPTSVLVTILAVGLILTQKLINRFAEPKKATVLAEKVTVDLSIPVNEVKNEPVLPQSGLTYRGFHYQHKNSDQSSLHKSQTKIKYRGLPLTVNNKLTNLSENISS
jgi:hypothetical protein